MNRRAISSIVALMAAFTLALSGCGAASGNGGGSITLTVATFGDFGYGPLFAQYEKAHPNIHVVGRVADFDTHHKQLITELAAGRGAADVEAIEVQYMPQFRQSTDKFVNLADYGAKGLRNQWTPWKWDQGVTGNGNFVMGLGTDMGSLAMCYRPDMFARAGLPTDRTKVSALWPTWQDYAAIGDRFTAANTGVKFTDSAGTVYTAMLDQLPQNYFAQSNDAYVAGQNSGLHTAFDLAASIGQKGETAQVTTYTPEWNVAIQQGSFATIACPAWMLTQIQQAGGAKNQGKWDVASIPANGGNDGGSFLTVPKQSAHPREAYDLAQWLTAPAQEKQLFLSNGILPSEPSAYQDPQVVGKIDPYFSNAPTGKIYASAADNLQPVYNGTQDAAVKPAFGWALGRVGDHKQTIDQAWAQAVSDGAAALQHGK